jgi:cyclopropane fatty-acyl-phospholipid synthase-like methyltransferase
VSHFDGIARAYRWLEYLAFGPSLQRARVAHLAALATCRDILVVGDGDGRCLRALVMHAPGARIHCIDTSGAMLREAARRVPDTGDHLSFECADVRAFDTQTRRWDAVVTMFVLDCLTSEEVQSVATKLSHALRSGGHWLFADFVIPARGWRRLRARLWIGCLYRFFRWRTGLEVSHLPPSERLIQESGLVAVAVSEHQAGMVRSIRYAKP